MIEIFHPPHVTFLHLPRSLHCGFPLFVWRIFVCAVCLTMLVIRAFLQLWLLSSSLLCPLLSVNNANPTPPSTSIQPDDAPTPTCLSLPVLLHAAFAISEGGVMGDWLYGDVTQTCPHNRTLRKEQSRICSFRSRNSLLLGQCFI